MAIRIATAPVSWGIYEFEGITPKYPYARVLDEIAETGYTGIELGPWGYMPTDPEVLRPEMDKRGLRLLSSYVPVAFANHESLDQGEAFALKVGKFLAALGAETIVLADDNGRVTDLVQRAGTRAGSSVLNAAEWDVYAAGVNRVARRVFDETGLRVVFHHHCSGYVETAEETRQLMDRVDADLIGLCLDTGHWVYAGGDAMDAVREYGSRVRYLHLKDCDLAIRDRAIREGLDYFAANGMGVYCELGQGSVDFPRILQHMSALGYDGWAIVEQDVFVDDLDAPKQSAQRNRDYLRTLGY